MADKKISELTLGAPAQGGDEVPVNRAGINFKLGVSDITALQSAFVFSNSNNVSFGTNGSTVTATATVATSLTNIRVSAGTTSNLLSSFTFSNSNGLAFGLDAGVFTGSYTVPGATVFSNSNNVSFGLNGSTITATATIATSLSNIRLSAGTTSNLASAFTFGDGGGISFGLNAGTVTATVQTNYLTTAALSDHSHGNPTLNLTNLSGTTASNSAGFTLSLSAGAPGGATPITISSLVCGNEIGIYSSASIGQNTLGIYPVFFKDYLSANAIAFPVAITNSSSAAASVQNGYTMRFGIYTTNATNATVLTRHYSTSYTIIASHNSNVSWMISLITAIGNSTSYNTVSASSAGLNLSLSLHGERYFIMPVSSLFTPGMYWLAYVQSSSSAGAVGSVLRLSNRMNVFATGNRLGLSTATAGQGMHMNLGMGAYSVTTGALPGGISMTQINAVGANIHAIFMSNSL